jgi:hypothetical protein
LTIDPYDLNDSARWQRTLSALVAESASTLGIATILEWTPALV